jgi:hypothetical protein
VAIVIAATRRSDDQGVDLDALRVGQCLQVPDAERFDASAAKIVDCSTTHNTEVYATGSAPPGFSVTPAEIDDNPVILQICRSQVPTEVLRALAGADGIAAGVLVSQSDQHRIVCTAVGPDRTGSIVSAANA